jgi:uncharacterized protein YyaL (SSP411 family)
MPNRLYKEKSPYLQQHSENPVDWYAWEQEAFDKAKNEHKPIFLSIGYATCHWCHVMEHESFEDPDITAYLNEHFVSIKVDREERPDIDQLYMPVCQMLTGQGGWPLTIIMTPEKEPFYAATYLPKEAQMGRLGLRQILRGIHGMWTNEQARVRKAIEQITQGYSQYTSYTVGSFPNENALKKARSYFSLHADPHYGGFGKAPKFPSPHQLVFLCREWYQHHDSELLESVVLSLKKMRQGGLWDHIGFGFHRYSTDEKWLLPHFEKMLYDQALMLMAYAEAWQITKEPLFKQTCLELFEYLKRDMLLPNGGFSSAEDADSEGEEGKFYTWSYDELNILELQGRLPEHSLSFLADYFGVTEEGNMLDEATKQRTGQNILHLTKELDEAAYQQWERIRSVLFECRKQRVRPLCDDKILCDWNALLVASLANAARLLNSEEMGTQAMLTLDYLERTFSYSVDSMASDDLENPVRWYHRHRDGETAIDAFAEDHSFLVWAYLECYGYTADSMYVQKALDLADITMALFGDDQGALVQTQDSVIQAFGTPMTIYDGAIPSANSAMAYCLIRLHHISGQTKWIEYLDKMGQRFSEEWSQFGSSITVAMMALQQYHYEPTQWVVVQGKDNGSSVEALKREIDQYYLPTSTVHVLNNNSKEALVKRIPSLANYLIDEAPSRVFLCQNYHCEAPIESLDQLRVRLKNISRTYSGQ